MNTPSISHLKNLAIASAVALCGCGAAQAATQYGSGSFTWDAGISSVWSMASGGPYSTAAWTNGNDAVFEGTAGAVSIDAAGVTAQNLTFNTDGFTVQNSTLTLSGTPVITAGANATISANIAGDAGLTKAGSANLTLLGTNTYSGSTSVSDGILQIGNATVNPSLNAATYTIGANSTLYLYSASFPNGQQSYFSQIAGSGLLEFNTAAPPQVLVSVAIMRAPAISGIRTSARDSPEPCSWTAAACPRKGRAPWAALRRLLSKMARNSACGTAARSRRTSHLPAPAGAS